MKLLYSVIGILFNAVVTLRGVVFCELKPHVKLHPCPFPIVTSSTSCCTSFSHFSCIIQHCLLFLIVIGCDYILTSWLGMPSFRKTQSNLDFSKSPLPPHNFWNAYLLAHPDFKICPPPLIFLDRMVFYISRFFV